MISVLIIDDSLVARSAVGRALSREIDIDVQRPAASGVVALQRISEQCPDVVVLDVEMPGMGGLEVLDEIRLLRPHLPVIMFSAVTEQGATTTLDALARGASDALAKPASFGVSSDAVADTMAELAGKIRVLGAGSRSQTECAVPRLMRPAKVAEVGLVVIAVSTGGPNALVDLLPRFAADFPVPIVIVQHMPPLFTRQLAERLDAKCALTVSEGESGSALKPGSVWIAPGDHHMSIALDGGCAHLSVHGGPKENSCRPAADVLFRTAAACYESGVLAVVLTGMGQDGLSGCEDIVARGGRVIAQDEETSVVWGMPGAVIRAGLADRVLPLSSIAGEMQRRVKRVGHDAQQERLL